MQKAILKRQVADEFRWVPIAKVLVVDDEDADLQYHRDLLEGQGHIVWACRSFSLGAEMAARDDFDLILLCQGSPAFEGRVVMERQRDRNRTTPVLVLAHCVDMRCYLEAMQLGAVDYLEKPVHPAEMKRVLRTHLQPALARG